MAMRWFLLIALVVLSGCGYPAAKLNEAKGHLQSALELWQSGGKPDELLTRPTAIEFHETLWKEGEKLLSFDITDVTYAEAAGAARCAVRLTVRNRKGKDRTESVLYDVTLGPPVRIINNPMP